MSIFHEQRDKCYLPAIQLLEYALVLLKDTNTIVFPNKDGTVSLQLVGEWYMHGNGAGFS